MTSAAIAMPLPLARPSLLLTSTVMASPIETRKANGTQNASERPSAQPAIVLDAGPGGGGSGAR